MVKKRTEFQGKNVPPGGKRLRFAVAFFLLAAGVLLPVVSARGSNGDSQPETLFQQATKLEKRLEEVSTYSEKEMVLLDLSEIYRQLRRFDRSIEALERLREEEGFATSPRRDSILLKLGDLYELRGDMEGAAEVYSTAVEEGEGDEAKEPGVSVGVVGFRLRTRYITVLERLGRFEEAKEELLELLSGDNAGYAAYAMTELVSMYRNGSLSDRDISGIADPLLEQYPDQAVRLAEALADRGRVAAAKYFYDELLRRSPGVLLPVSERAAQFYASQDSLDQMIQELEDGQDGSSDRVRLLVRFYRFRGDLDKALETVRKEAAEKKEPELLREQGDLEMAAGQYGAAAGSYEAYIQRTRAVDSEMYRKLGEAYFLAGQKEEARKAWQRMLPALANSSLAYQDLSEILDQYGMSEEAVKMMEEAVKRSPGSPLYVPRLLHLYLKNNRFDDAVAGLTALARTRTGLGSAMTDSLLQATETPEAREMLLEAARAALEKTDPAGRRVLLDLLFEIYLRSGKYDEAVEQVKTVGGLEGEQRLYVLGQNLRAFGEDGPAARAYLAIPPSSPYYLPARVEATEALMEQGDPAEALGCAADAIQRITGSEQAAAAVREASPELYDTLSGLILGATGVQGRYRGDVSDLLVSLGDLWVREKKGRPALSALLLANRIPAEGRRVSSQSVIREAVLTGHAYSLLGDFKRAREMYELVSGWRGPMEDEGEFMLAELDLWEGKTEEAKKRYEALLEQDLARSVINDVLARMYFLSQLSPDEVEVYAAATRFAWQGRWDDAIDRYRTLAARRQGDHIAAWSLLAVGDILAEEGKPDEAKSEWERLLETAEDPALQGQLRFRLLEAEEADASADPEAVYEGYRKIIEDMPDTIFADEARRVIGES